MSVLVSPLIAWAVATAVLRFVQEPHVQAAQGTVAVAIFYGLVWGLTVRERRPARQSVMVDSEMESGMNY